MKNQNSRSNGESEMYGSMATLDEFDEGFEREVVAYLYEVSGWSVFDDAPDRQHPGGWTTRVSREEPNEEDWKQEETVQYRIQNVTPLVRGSGEIVSEEAVAFEYEYVGMDGEPTKALRTEDPRGGDSLLRCTPLVPASQPNDSD